MNIYTEEEIIIIFKDILKIEISKKKMNFIKLILYKNSIYIF